MNVDRQNRDALVDAIRRYLAEEITAYDLDDEIFRIVEESTDPTIELAAQGMSSLYEELKDDKVVLSKEQRDVCQRLILLLESDAHLKIKRIRQWSVTQLVAGIAFLAFLTCAARLGFGYHLLALAVPFGLLSIGLSWYRCRLRSSHSDNVWAAVTPFSSILEILAIRHRVADFAREGSRVSHPGRKVRSAGASLVLVLLLYAAWMMTSPVVLFLQTLPVRVTQTRVETS